MHIEKAVSDILLASGAVTALCPAAQIYPDSDIQNVELPSIKHFVVADKSIYTHDGPVTSRDCEFYQVSVFATNIKAVRPIAEAVIAALSGVHTVSGDGITGFHVNTRNIPYDLDVRAAGMAVEFAFWYGSG